MRFQSRSVSTVQQNINQLLGIPPPTTNTTPQTYIDPTGEQWVADANVYSGGWRRARDVMRSQVYRSTGYNTIGTGAETVFPFDTADYDAYGCWNLATGVFTAQIDGYYIINTNLHFSAPAVSQRMYARFANTGIHGDLLFWEANPGPYATSMGGTAEIPLGVGNTLNVTYSTSTVLAVMSPGLNSCWCQINFSRRYHVV